MNAMSRLDEDPSLATSTSSWGETAIQAASHLGHRRLIVRLVESGVELDVFAAAALADLEAVASMISGRPKDVCGIHDLPLMHFAVVSRDPGVVEALMAAGVPPNPPAASLSALHSAVSVGSTQMIRALVSGGADVSFSDGFGGTALDWAYWLRETDPEVLRLLGTSSARDARQKA